MAAAATPWLRARVPARTYDELRPWVERAAGGRGAGPHRGAGPPLPAVVRQRRPSKLLPWTAPFALELRRAVSAWLADMALPPSRAPRRPRLLVGEPGGARLRRRRPAGSRSASRTTPSTSGPFARRLAAWGLAVPGAVRHLAEVDAWRRRTLLHLLRARELRLLSILEPVVPAAAPRAAAVAPAGARPGDRLGSPPALGRADRSCRRSPPTRARREIVEAGPEPLALWPRLALVSCWADGPVGGRGGAARARCCPASALEPKGLIATEGVVSIPFGGGRPARGHVALRRGRDGRRAPARPRAARGGRGDADRHDRRRALALPAAGPGRSSPAS